MGKLFSVAEVDACLAGLRRDFGTQEVPLEEAGGGILREPILADREGPPFTRATMDGYALRWADFAAGHRQFHIAGRQWPGSPALDFPAEPGACVEIMTGAPCPKGADCIVPFEQTSVSQEIVSLVGGVKINSGQCIHPRGSDFPAGAELVPAGTLLRSPEIGIAASCGRHRLRVARFPLIGLFSTGDELVPVSSRPEPTQIRSSNTQVLRAGLLAAGVPLDQIELLHIADEREAVATNIQLMAGAYEVVIITGGISKGRKDWVAPVLEELGDTLFHGVSQRPGKPMGCWTLPGPKNTVVFALPGNPVSALTGLHRYVLPWLLANAGLTNARPTVKLPLAADCEKPSGLTWFLPVYLDPEGLAQPAPTNTSGDYAGLQRSSGFVEAPAELATLRAGERYPFTPWL